MTSVDGQACVQWLVRCRVLLPEDKLVQSRSGVLEELAERLKDGVLLCCLLNRLKTGAIDQKSFSMRPQTSQFLSKKNISVFLETCRSKFGLMEKDLFNVCDLYEAKNIPHVVRTLSTLSGTPVAQSLKIAPFDYHISIASSTEDAATKRLSNDSARASDYVEDDDGDDEIYKCLIDVAGSPVSQGSTALPIKNAASEEKSNRDKCIEELFNTESNYVEQLKKLIVHFMNRLEDCLELEDFKKIFFGIRELFEVNKKFCERLKTAMMPNASINISDCFVASKDDFIVYGEYCARLKSAQERLDSLCRNNSTIEVKIKDCQYKAYEGHFKLRDLLALPMQRILKYHLFLKELIKNTTDRHPDRDNLDVALEEILNIGLFINEMTRDYEIMQQIEMIQKSIVGLEMMGSANLCHYGRLLMDGELLIKHGTKAVKQRYLFLFDKVLIICKAKSQDLYDYKDFLVPHDYEVDSKIVKDKSLYNAFCLTTVQSSDDKWTFGSKDSTLINKWFETIKLARDNVKPPGAVVGKYHFMLNWFDKPQKCVVCGKLLRGVFYKGYLCKNTGKIVHKECIVRVDEAVETAKARVNKVQRMQTYRNSRVMNEKMTLFGTTDVSVDPVESTETQQMAVHSNAVNRQMRRNQSICDSGCGPPRTVPQHAVEFPSGATSRRRNTVPDLPPPNSCAVPKGIPTYVNTAKEPWFAGEMTRENADKILSYLPEGSFMVRQSVSGGRVDKFAISINFLGSCVKHLRIEEDEQKGGFYLHSSSCFNSISSLVCYYRKNSLGSHFSELRTTLRLPYREAIRQMKASGSMLGFCVALYDYYPSEPNQLTFKMDDVIVLQNTQYERDGWWKGSLNGMEGYFPKAYVYFDDEM